ncbi:MAG: hypothetical protein M3N29_09175 [Chloroflexota bacterium]|nr:hypothetical protein [Chloroflexota bacterium]
MRALNLLLASGDVQVVAVLASSGGGRRGATVAQAAAARGIAVWPPRVLTYPATAGLMAATSVDLMLNVHSLVVVADALLDVPTLGAFNLHPGPLPRYAGLNSPLWAVYRSENRYGATLHRMTTRIDAGPIFEQQLFDVAPRETGLSLTVKAVQCGLGLLERFVRGLPGSADPRRMREQDQTRREYLGEGPPDGGRLRWRLPASRLDAFVRACDFGPFPSPWGHPSVTLRARRLHVLAAETAPETPESRPPGTVISVSGGAASVATGEGLLVLKKLEVDGRLVDAAEVIRHGQSFDVE